MAHAMRGLQISIKMQAQIDRMWTSLDVGDWLEIEEKALVELEQNREAKIKLLALPVLLEVLPKFTGFEQSEIDSAVFRAAVWVLGRPALAAYYDTFDSESPLNRDTIDSQEDSHFGDELEGRMPPAFSGRLRDALAWSQSEASEQGDDILSDNEFTNGTIDADDELLREPILRPMSPPSPPTRPTTFRRRFIPLRPRA
jgi:hypothetical protein